MCHGSWHYNVLYLFAEIQKADLAYKLESARVSDMESNLDKAQRFYFPHSISTHLRVSSLRVCSTVCFSENNYNVSPKQ